MICAIFKRCRKWFGHPATSGFHFTAQPLVRRSYLDPLGTWSTNVQAPSIYWKRLVLATPMCRGNGNHRQGLRQSRMGFRLPEEIVLRPRSRCASKAALSWQSPAGEPVSAGQASDAPSAIASARSGNVIGGVTGLRSHCARCVPWLLMKKSLLNPRQPGLGNTYWNPWGLHVVGRTTS